MNDLEVEAQIFYNAIQTPDGTILHSTHVHDYQDHTDTLSGEYYMIDGGNSYVRTTINKRSAKSLLVDSNSDHKDIREVFTWGNSMDKDGNALPKTVYLLLKDITEAHLTALITWTDGGYPCHINRIFRDEEVFRLNQVRGKED